MKTLYALILAFILPLSAMAGNGSANVSAVLNIGGSNANPGPLTIPDSNPTGYFSLTSPAASGTTPIIWFSKNGSGTQYQVPAGKTTRCTSVSYLSYQAVTPGTGTPGVGSFKILTGTASWSQGATSVTGANYTGGSSSYAFAGALAAVTWYNVQVIVDFAQNLFPGVDPGTNNPIVVNLNGCKEF